MSKQIYQIPTTEILRFFANDKLCQTPQYDPSAPPIILGSSGI